MEISTNSIRSLRESALKSVIAAKNLQDVEDLRLKLLGKKGELSLLMKGLKDLSPEVRKEVGSFLNSTKSEIESSLEQQKSLLESAELSQKLEVERIDVTLPIRTACGLASAGSMHPVTKVQYELERIFVSLGFTVVDGPELESEYYNFEALNIPSTHPARDMQDTLWTRAGTLLRTHTSSIQVRALESNSPPLRLVAPGRCFRAERIDSSHEHTFYQMEGIMVDREVGIGHLLYFMKTLLREVFGSEQKIRLRPGYFPFVEPGFELDIWFQGRWLELLPCGLVHPRVLEYGGIDPSKWQGFAFGLGLSRLVMSRFQIDDIRHMQSGDLRFLRQFS